MTLIEVALAKEKTGEYLAAIQIYEKIISGIGAPIDAFINLSFILWEFAAEFSFSVAHNIPPEWGEIGSKKYLLVVEKGLLNFPNSVELLFWSKYFPYRLYNNDFSKDDCLALIEKYGESDSLVPYFYLFLFNRIKYMDKRNMLLIECEKTPTAKNDYIKSLIE
jgi:hypothetical protein